MVRDAGQIKGRRILLVDDVFTTGATLRAASDILKKAGASRIIALTLARVDARSAAPPVSIEPLAIADRELLEV